jgi:hypothetical protein
VLADRAARTVATLSEALDRHRGKGQQQITVKHVTVNADQAVIADTVVGSRKEPAEASNEAKNSAFYLAAIYFRSVKSKTSLSSSHSACLQTATSIRGALPRKSTVRCSLSTSP